MYNNQIFLDFNFIKITREFIGFYWNNQLLYIPRLNIPVIIRWYGLAYLLSFLIIKALVWKKIQELKLQFSSDDFESIVQNGFVICIIGGRMWFLINRYLEFGLPIWENALTVWEGGMTFHGGLIFGILYTYIVLIVRKQKKDLGLISNIIALYLPIANIIGRLGNFMNQEFLEPFLGLPSCLIFGITEGLLPLVLINTVFKNTVSTPYKTCWICLLLYATARFLNDIYRLEPNFNMLFLNLKVSQYVCLGLIVVSIFGLFKIKKSSRKSPKLSKMNIQN